jgi:predicted RNase H-like nuclease (RuvC/YqgF family)
LETLVESKRAEVSRIEKDTVKAQREQAALESVIKRLQREEAKLHAAITEEQKFVRKETQAVATIVRDAATELKHELKNSVAESLAEVRDFGNQALELGKELGRLEATIEANQWLQTLVALVKGDGSTTAKEVRAVGIPVLRGMRGWMEQNRSQVSLPSGLTMRLSSTIEDLERWKT